MGALSTREHQVARGMFIRVVFACLGLFAFAIGIVDLFGAAETPSRILGAVLLISGVVLGAGAFDPWSLRFGFSLGSIAGAMGATVAIGIVVAALYFENGSLWLVALLTAALTCVAAIFFFWDRTKDASNHLPTVAGVLLALLPGGALLGTFQYLVPSKPALPHLSISADHSVVSTPDGRRVLVVQVAVENTGPDDLITLDSIYRVTGVASSAQPSSTRGEFDDRLGEALKDGLRPLLSQTATVDEAPSRPTVLEAGRFVPQFYSFGVHEKYETRLAVDIPPDGFKSIHTYFGLPNARANRVEAAEIRLGETCLISGARAVETITPLADKSLIRQIVRGSFQIASYWFLTPPAEQPQVPVPELQVTIDPRSGYVSDAHWEKTSRFFRVAWATAAHEVALSPAPRSERRGARADPSDARGPVSTGGPAPEGAVQTEYPLCDYQ